MKKTAALILALAMVLGLCACGQKVTEDVPATNPVSQVTPQDTIDERSEFEDLVLYEDENVTITLVEFYTEKLIAIGDSSGGKCATFKVENKTDSEVSVWVLPYLNNETLQATMVDGTTAVEAGRIGRMGFAFTYGVYPNWEDLESLDDLYNLEFTFELHVRNGTPSYKAQCSVAAALNGESDAVEAMSNPEKFSVREDIHFGDSMDEVAAKEQRFEIDYESAGENGYIIAQARNGGYDTVTFEGVEDAYLFYLFDAKEQDLSQVLVMFGHGGDRLSMLNTYEGFLKLYFERYGIQLTDDQMQYIPIDTVAYEYAATRYEDAQLEKHNRWLINDAEGYVIIDVATSVRFGDSYYTFVGMRHVTEDEIVAAGGDLSAIMQE